MSLVVPFDEIFSQELSLLTKHPSWQRVELGGVLSILNGFAFKSNFFSKSDGYPIIRIRDIQRNFTDTFYQGEFSDSYIVHPGDLIVGMDGNFLCSEWKGAPALLNQRVCKLTTDPTYLNQKFLSFGINGYLKAIQEATSSVTVGHLSSKDILRIPFPLPPLNEQHRIVDKLEKLLAKVDKCKERLEKIPAILKRFRQSVLAAACSGELTRDWRKRRSEIGTSEDLLKSIQQEKEKTQNKYGIVKKKALEKTSATITRASVPQDEPEIPQSWLYIPSFDLFSFVTSGSRGWAKYYSQEGAKFIRIGNLAHDTIDLNLGSVQHVIPPDGSEGIRTRIQKHDILVSITADTGMIGLIQEDIGEAYINQHIALSRPVKGLDTKYLAWFLASKEGQRQFKALQRGATKVGLGLDDIKSIWVPLPSIAEQKEIVNRIEALFRIADEVETRYQKAKNHVNQLTQSILAKAFRGELVPQDPKDEPASELLKRIKAERDVVKNAPKGHRKTRRLG